VLIVGGGPAGAAAAVYAARKGIRTGIVAERFGGQTMDTLGIENYISVLETRGPEVRRRAGSARAPLRRGHHERQRVAALEPAPSPAAMPRSRWKTARTCRPAR
jgi:alkyl hydroperoxide reductase subunit F